MNKSTIRSIIATDCGSTTTKCILIELVDGEYRLALRGESPTTVEAPVEDVTQGVINAIREVQEMAGRPILDDDNNIIRPYNEEQGVDLYLSTSSAGGGLQMVVGGVIQEMTAKTAEKAALGAGAIVLDSFAVNDGRLPYQKIERIRQLRPDMVLLAGGIDGGTVKHVMELAEVFASANPQPRLGSDYQLPVIFAGNQDANPYIKELLQSKVALDIVPNLRPVLEIENLQPAQAKIQDQFLEHVMAQAPGYPRLMKLTDRPIMPTPAAVGSIMQRIATKDGINILGVDIGGATTDVFSVVDETFNRSVSANYGMSYSLSQVFLDAGLDNVMRWIPFDIAERDLRNRVKNKMIRPTSIPFLLKELVIEQAMAREALRLSLDQHKLLCTDLKGVQKSQDIASLFQVDTGPQSLVQMMTIDMIIGSGGVLSHAPNRAQTALMLIDAFLPEGVTRLTVDSIFMMPQLGVLAEIHPEAATQVFEKDCLVELGTCIAPVGESSAKKGQPLATITIDGKQYDITGQEIKVVSLEEKTVYTVEITPEAQFDVGSGPGVPRTVEVLGGVVGLVLDGRGRPWSPPEERQAQITTQQQTNRVFNCYPEISEEDGK